MNKSIEQLTPTEINVLKMIVEGKTNKEIAESLMISLSTVMWHVQNIFDKTAIRNRKALIVEYYLFFQQNK